MTDGWKKPYTTCLWNNKNRKRFFKGMQFVDTSRRVPEIAPNTFINCEGYKKQSMKKLTPKRLALCRMVFASMQIQLHFVSRFQF